ncbi:VWA domain containing CoxE-like protein [Tepidimonas thermarum]|uniref:VWA domain containing CoxE-like protein n=1 Tax=Tepidimonas thermarum TaxID=335431 RepID=A0A554X0I0_9BURK|nr:VWA domain-containing protein [Tepidimonas thermarum]TSE29359.1 VWA domain containing CoxE-like protein [Tepidimonas thermarum]
MLIDFFYTLRAARLPVSVKEYLTLLEALQAGVVGPLNPEACSIEDFYYLARTTLVKDEKHYDKFDRAFAAFFHGVEQIADFTKDIPADWLRQTLQRVLSEEQKANAPRLAWDQLMEELRKRLEEQKERHEGGSKWIGTGGTSPFGHGGHNPQGIRIGGKGGGKSAVKVWEQRSYRDYDDTQELGTRNIKMALRRLRRFAREGSELELDLPDTIRATAANAGYLDIKMVPERHNHVKVLLLMDVGGTMDEHIQRVEELFSAARAEFKHLEFYYFHNCVYDYVWKNNRRRYAEKLPTWDVIRKYNKDYKLIFVGDATMSPYEILQPGGSVEYHNEEPGAEWLQRLTHAFPRFAWINPEPQGIWQYRQSIAIIQQLMGGRMFPLTLKGLEDAMRLLSK